jgi:8-oxoguanine deaminase
MLTITGASHILIDNTTDAQGDLVMADGRVVSIGGTAAAGAFDAAGAARAAGAEAAETLDVSGCVVTPGLVNAHHHLFQTAFRTLPGTRSGTGGGGR